MESVLRELFDAPELDLERLRDVAARGVPDNLRATVWKFLLGYTPLRKAKREATVAASREQYVVFLDEVVTRPQHDPDEAAVAAQSPAPEASSTGGGTAPSSSMPVSPALGSPSSGGSPELRPVHLKRLEVVDDPLAHAATATAATAPEGGSKWEQWHLDEELRVEIDKDIQARKGVAECRVGARRQLILSCYSAAHEPQLSLFLRGAEPRRHAPHPLCVCKGDSRVSAHALAR